MNLKFDEKGLIPAIVQDHYTKEVLTLAYMNAETLALTIAEGRTVFWSRSRQEIWRKGETSGNVQRVVSITADCDKDALVVEVVKSGHDLCHLGLLLGAASQDEAALGGLLDLNSLDNNTVCKRNDLHRSCPPIINIKDKLFYVPGASPFRLFSTPFP